MSSEAKLFFDGWMKLGQTHFFVAVVSIRVVAMTMTKDMGVFELLLNKLVDVLVFCCVPRNLVVFGDCPCDWLFIRYDFVVVVSEVYVTIDWLPLYFLNENFFFKL